MPQWYAEMDVLVLPSRTTPTWAEQFGRVLTEALSCGTCVVGSDSGEIPWVIGTTGGGMVFPEDDVAALAETLTLLRDSERRRSFVEVGQMYVNQNMTASAVARSFAEVLVGATEVPDEVTSA